MDHLKVEWVKTLTPDTLIDMVQSRSYVITMPAEERASVLVAVREFLERRPELAGRVTINLAYMTHCSRAVRGEPG